MFLFITAQKKDPAPRRRVCVLRGLLRANTRNEHDFLETIERNTAYGFFAGCQAALFMG
jgi:hypothetical protein